MAVLRLSKKEMASGFSAGLTLIQVKTVHPQEIAWADELVEEGKAVASSWTYRDGSQCELRRITGVPQPDYAEAEGVSA